LGHRDRMFIELMNFDRETWIITVICIEGRITDAAVLSIVVGEFGKG
jgi:hypothetical protein